MTTTVVVTFTTAGIHADARRDVAATEAAADRAEAAAGRATEAATGLPDSFRTLGGATADYVAALASEDARQARRCATDAAALSEHVGDAETVQEAAWALADVRACRSSARYLAATVARYADHLTT